MELPVKCPACSKNLRNVGCVAAALILTPQEQSFKTSRSLTIHYLLDGCHHEKQNVLNSTCQIFVLLIRSLIVKLLAVVA